MKVWNLSLALVALAAFAAPGYAAETQQPTKKPAATANAVETAAAPAAEVPATVEPATPVQTSTTEAAESLADRFTASYLMWITGPMVGGIDGKIGKGSNVTLDQFATVGFKASKKWKVSVTQPWTNTIHHDSEGKDNLVWQNPYITASNSSFTKSTKYGTNLAGYVRYYMPFAHSSADNVGKQADAKYGVLRGVLVPSKTFMDGKLTVSGDIYAQRYFAGARPSATDTETLRQRDWRFYLYPHVSYQLTPKASTYVAYFNDLEHYRNDKERGNGGHWRKFNHKHLIEFGFELTPVAGLLLNPYFEYGGEKWIPRNTTVNLIAEYAFL